MRSLLTDAPKPPDPKPANWPLRKNLILSGSSLMGKIAHSLFSSLATATGLALSVTFLASAVWGDHLGVPGKGPVNQEGAMEIANEALRSLGKKAYEFDVTIDRGEGWQAYMEYRREGKTKESHDKYEQAELKLKGKTYWAISYSIPSSPGQIIADGGILVFVDANTGVVIEILNNP